MSKKRRMILIASLVMSMTAGSAAAATLAACGKPTPQITIDDVSGVYFGTSGGKSCEVDLDESGATKKFVLVSSDKSGSGTYVFDGTNITLTFDNTETLSGKMTKGSDGTYSLTLTINGTTYVLNTTSKYVVTFKYGNETLSTVEVVSGQKVSAPAAPAKNGYGFAGWYADSSLTTEFDFANTIITAATTVYARYVQIDATKNVYTVKFDAGEGVTNPADIQTVNGVAYNLPTVSKSGATFAGWWFSESGNGTKLTYKYEGQELKANTTLYAVWDDGRPLVSVTSTGIKWTARGVNNTYRIVIVAPDGNEVVNTSTGQTSYTYNFSQDGEYKITVSLGSSSMTVYHSTNALDKVSIFTVTGNILSWSAVDKAEKYLITVDCGNKQHNHTDLDLGNATQYDFSNCEMQPDGIKFVVKAVAQGYDMSVSDEYVVNRTLAAVTGIAVNADTEVITWDSVTGATSYNLKISNDSGVIFEGTAASGEKSLKSNISGNYTIEVTPVAHGYNSPAATSFTYVKSRLAAPTNLRINGYVLSWDAVDGATSYTVKINDKTYNVPSGTSYDFSALAASGESLTLSVCANAADSSAYSDAISINSAVTSASYNKGKVSWNYVHGATKFEVQVNDDNPIIVDGDTVESAITFNQSGENIIRIFAYNASNNQIGTPKSITVNVYAINFNTTGGLAVDSIYLATGDELVLPGAVYAGYDLEGWYDAAGGADVGAKKITNGTFNGTADVTYYAYWIGKLYDVTLHLENGESVETTTVSVRFGQKFTLPVPTNTDNRLGFAGWATESRGQGNLITDSSGDSLAVWSVADADVNEVTLYARWLEIYRFNLLSDGTYSVQKGAQTTLASVTKIRIPDTYMGRLVSMIEGAAFQSCTNLLEIEIPNSIQVVQTGSQGGNLAGSAFQGCTKLESVIVYEVEGYTGEVVYSSHEGALIYYRDTTGETELVYYPYGKQGDYVVPDGVTTLPINVFRSCSLTKITIPASVKYIGETAFYSCSKLTEVEFLSSDDENTKELTLGETVFKSCSKLVKVTFPKHLGIVYQTVDGETIANDFYDLFTSCTVLAEVYIDGGVGKNYASTDDGLLLNSDKNTIIYCPLAKAGDYTVASGITAIGYRAFYKCTKLTSITISSQVTQIGVEAFRECTYIKSVTFLGETHDADLTIEERAFYKLTNGSFTQVVLPANLTVIKDNAFGYCTYLKTVTVNCDRDELSYSSYAFNRVDADVTATSGSSTIVTVNIGANVKEFDVKGVFGGPGNKLTTVNVDPLNENYASENGVLFNGDKTSILYYPSNKTDTTYVIPASVTRIGSKVFSDITSFVTITIGKNVTYIADQAFYNCTGLTSLNFEAGGSEDLIIAATAFENCTALATVTLPERLVELGSGAFKNCTGLVSVNLPASLTTLASEGNEASVFEGCINFANINVAAGSETFSSADGVLLGVKDGVAVSVLYSPVCNSGDENGVVTLPSTIIEIVASAFANNAYIKEIKFTAAAEVQEITIGEKAFYKATALEKIALPVGLKSIESLTFYNCPALTEVSIPYTVTTIKSAAFARCFELDKVTFEETPQGVEAATLTLAAGTAYYSNTSSVTEANETKCGVFANCKLTDLTLPSRLATISGYTFAYATIGELTIPEGVTTIGTYAFYYAELTSASMPSTITLVDTYAFRYCSNMTSIEFAASKNNVTFGNYAFANCTALEEVTLPTKLTSTGTYVFQNDAALTTINLGETTVATIGNYTFSGCSSLSSVVLPDTLTTLGTYTFQNCTSLTTVQIESASLATIDNAAFSGCSSLTTINIPEGVTTIGGGGTTTGAFANCTSLETITLPASIQTINAYAFNGCTSLHTITFTTKNASAESNKQVSDLRTIGAGAFQYTAITSFTFPESSNSSGITPGAALFSGCTKLTTLNLSSSVVSVTQLFEGCASINTITIAADNANLSKDSDLMENARLIFNVAGTVIKAAYAPVTDAPGATYTIPEGITDIEAYAFKAQNNIKNLILPSTLRTIGAYAFQNCRLLEWVKFNVGEADSAYEGTTALTSIGEWAFQSCLMLSKMTVDNGTINTLPSTVTTLGNYAFSKTGFETFTVPATVTSAGTYLFYQGTALREVYHLSTSIGNYSYNYCVNLKTVYLNNALTAFTATYVFQNCRGIETLKSYDVVNNTAIGNDGEVTFPAGLTSLPNSIFNGAGFKKVVIPSTITSIGTNAFQNCTYLEEVEFAADVTGLALSNYMFDGCTALTTITNPGAIGTIGTYTFRGCTSLLGTQQDDGEWKLILPNCESIGNYAFTGCTGLIKVSLPKCSNIGTYAFSYSSNYNACNSITDIELATDENIEVVIGNYAFGYSITNSGTAESVFQSETLYSLKHINFDRVVSLGAGALAGAPIVEASFPVCASFGSKALQNCRFLEKVTLSTTVDVTLADYVFGYITQECASAKLKEINLENVISIAYGCFYGCAELGGTLVVDESGNPVLNESGEKQYVIDLSGSPLLGRWSFSYCDSITDIKFGADTTFEEYADNRGAFSYCKGLKRVTGPIKSILRGAFYYCENLEYIDLSAATYIGYCAFESCYMLDNIDLSNVETVDYAAFEHCHSLTEVDLSSAKSLGDWAFNLCKSLTTVNLGPNITKLPLRAFSQCPELVSIDLSNIKEIGQYAFSSDTKLAGTIDLSNVVSMDTYAFYGCESIEEVLLSPTLKEIAAYSFYGCASLKSIDIPGSVATIGNSAFFEAGLEGELDISGVAYVGADAFAANNLSKIIFGEFTSSIGNDAFGQNASLTEFEVSEDNAYFMTDSQGALYAKASDEEMQTLICYPAGKEGDVVIPANTIIAPYAFAGCYNVTSVTLPEGTTVISDHAFWWFRGEIKFTIPETVTEIENGAFQGTLMDEIVLPDGLEIIGANAFRSCENLTTIVIPEGVTTIGDYAFAYCENITEIVIPASVTSIGAHAFDGCTSLASITLQKGLETIGESAFYGCTALTEITIPQGVQTIGDYAFEGCTGLTTAIFEDDFGVLGTSAFYGCTELTTVTFKGSVEMIGAGAFSRKYTSTAVNTATAVSGEETYLENLTTVTFGGSIGTIAIHAFRYSGITEIELPAGITQLGNYAFGECLSLKKVTLNGDVETFGSYMFYKCTALENLILKEGVTTVGSNAFSYCGSEAEKFEVVLPSTMTKVPTYAFYQGGLTSITLPEGVESIDTYAFYQCNRLATVEFPSTLTSIGNSAFYMTGLKEVVVPALTTVGSGVFQGCAELEKVTLSDDLTTIGVQMFYNCPKLTSIKIPASVTTWGSGSYGAFEGSGLEEIELEEGLTSIGSYAFKGTKITNIEFPASLDTLNNYAFEGCELLESVKLPASVTTWGSYIFRNCVNLTNVEIEEGVERIGSDMFTNCTKIKQIVIPKTVNYMAAAFGGWTSEQTIIIKTVAGLEPSLIESSSGWILGWMMGCGAKIVVEIDDVEDDELD